MGAVHMCPALLFLILGEHLLRARMEQGFQKISDFFWVIKNVLPKVYERLKDLIPINSHALRGVVNLNGPTTKKGTDNFCQVFWEIGCDVLEGSCFTTWVS